MATSSTAVSARKLQANRQNAAKSTGPRTAEGKSRSSRNRVSHGFYSRDLLLPGEDRAELEELRQELQADLRPRGAMQELVVERLLALHWRLRRLLQAEGELLAYHAKQDPRQTPAQRLAGLICNGAEADRLSIYLHRLENGIHRCMRELRLLRKEQDEPDEQDDRHEQEPEHHPQPEKRDENVRNEPTVEVAAAAPMPALLESCHPCTHNDAPGPDVSDPPASGPH